MRHPSQGELGGTRIPPDPPVLSKNYADYEETCPRCGGDFFEYLAIRYWPGLSRSGPDLKMKVAGFALVGYHPPESELGKSARAYLS